MPSRDSEPIRIGEVEVRPGEGMTVVAGRVLGLSQREFRLLVALTRSAGRILAREELYRAAWEAELRTGDRTVDVYVHKLRAKLERAAPGWSFIHTHVGFGYRFSPDPSHAFHNSDTAR